MEAIEEKSLEKENVSFRPRALIWFGEFIILFSSGLLAGVFYVFSELLEFIYFFIFFLILITIFDIWLVWSHFKIRLTIKTLGFQIAGRRTLEVILYADISAIDQIKSEFTENRSKPTAIYHINLIMKDGLNKKIGLSDFSYLAASQLIYQIKLHLLNLVSSPDKGPNQEDP